MTEFDPEKFEEKYVHYFDEIETAYSNAYQQLHGQVDSTVLQAIDRQVLSESEPVYEVSAEQNSADNSSGQRGGSTASTGTAEPSPGPREHDGEFRVVLPDDLEERRRALPGDDETFDAVLEEFVDRIEHELRRIFGFAE